MLFIFMCNFFNQELSGLYGGYLEPQTEFASLCIKKIFRFYPEHIRSKLQIILIGHSVVSFLLLVSQFTFVLNDTRKLQGGLISRGVVSLNYIDSRLISYIFTLATPNVKPGTVTGSFLSFYHYLGLLDCSYQF